MDDEFDTNPYSPPSDTSAPVSVAIARERHIQFASQFTRLVASMLDGMLGMGTIWYRQPERGLNPSASRNEPRVEKTARSFIRIPVRDDYPSHRRSKRFQSEVLAVASACGVDAATDKSPATDQLGTKES